MMLWTAPRSRPPCMTIRVVDDHVYAGLTIGETKVGDDQIRLCATVRDVGTGGCPRRCGLNTSPPTLQDPAHPVEDKHIVVDHHHPLAPCEVGSVKRNRQLHSASE